ncbi:hypothetical protein AX15_005924 [Amanita polypyramis BW_CC]|nr:hypothetical protein AX15_005924 [Amanita polypyramis BW_CC]
MEARKIKLGAGHPDTLSSMVNMAVTYGSQGKLSEAEVLLVQAIKSMEQLIGPQHPRTLNAMKNLQTLQVFCSQKTKSGQEILISIGSNDDQCLANAWEKTFD